MLGTRLRRDPANRVFEEHKDELASADAAAVEQQITMIRQELCAPRPRRRRCAAR